MCAFAALFALAQPPLVLLANRVEPVLFGVSFLYAYLTVVYLAMMALLLWVYWRRL